jgi:Reverse transcriptase (RNA-dependent DNA polymerase)
MGDFNTNFNYPDSHDYHVLDSFCVNNNIINVASLFNIQHYFTRSSGNNLSTIDYIFCNKDLTPSFMEIKPKPNVGGHVISDHLGLVCYLGYKPNSDIKSAKRKRVPLFIFYLDSFRDSLITLIDNSFDWIDLKPKVIKLIKSCKNSSYDENIIKLAKKKSLDHKSNAIWTNIDCWKKTFLPKTSCSFNDALCSRIRSRLRHSNPANPDLFQEWDKYITPQPVPNIIFDSENVLELLDSLPNLKATGPDLIPYEFFKIHKDILAPVLSKTFAYWFYFPDCIPFDFHTGFISPIPKPKSDDFRLISLINTDRKIFTKLLSNHIFKFANFCDLQIGFRPGLWINENILIFNDILQNNNSFIELIDFKNAFDSVDFKWIDYVLKSSFSNTWYKVLMHCIGGTSYLNYDYNLPVFLESGVRQGDCISSILFNICINPLLRRIDSNITGHSLLNINIPALAYADDVTIITTSKSNHDRCWKFINEFCLISGLSVNLNKSFSVCKKKSHLPHTTEFKYLGIDYSDNKINWNSLCNKLIIKYQFYHNFIKRFYTCTRVLLFNALISSTLVYHLRSFPAPDSLFEAYRNIVLQCFPRVSYDRLVASKSTGGFGLMDINICNKNWLSHWRFYMINRYNSLKNSIYLTLCDRLSDINNTNTHILICWSDLSPAVFKYTAKNRLFHWTQYFYKTLFYFGDKNSWPEYWTWNTGDIFLGPFTDLSKANKSTWDITPAFGKDLLYFIKSFTRHRTYESYLIHDFKSLKIFKPKTYCPTLSQLKFGSQKNIINKIKEILSSSSTIKAKHWAIDQIHNANGLAINKEICFVCDKTIKSCHFLLKCHPPDTASFPDWFTNIDIKWCLYLTHLHRKYPDFHSNYNLLSDFNLL